LLKALNKEKVMTLEITGGGTQQTNHESSVVQTATIEGTSYEQTFSSTGGVEWTNKTTGEKVSPESNLWSQLNPVTVEGKSYYKVNDSMKGTIWAESDTGNILDPSSKAGKSLYVAGTYNFDFDLEVDTLRPYGDVVVFVKNPLYQQDSGNPGLPNPNEGRIPDILPYGAPEQKLVKDYYFDQVGIVLVDLMDNHGLSEADVDTIFEALVKGEPLSDPRLQQIAESVTSKATAKTITECNLPNSWTLQSTDAADWTPFKLEPYSAEKQKEINANYDASLNNKIDAYILKNNLSPEMAASLRAAAAGGKVSSDIVDAYVELSNEAKLETQTKFGLSSSWFRGVETSDTWIPVNIGVITPAKVNNARLDILIANLDQMAVDLEAAATKLLDGMPEGPAKVAMTEFLKIIGDAIKDMKATMRSLQTADAEKSKKETEGKLAALGDKRARMEEQAKKTDQSLKKTIETKASGQSMKIVGPLIAAFMTLLGALIAIFTLGIASEVSVIIIAAGIAVGIALTLYAMMDSITDCSAKIGKAINESIEKTCKNSPAWVKSLVKALLIAVIAVILILMMIVTGGGASGGAASAVEGVAAQATAQIVKQIIQEMIKQLTLQVVMMLVMSSNIVPELVGNVLKAAGVKPEVVQAIEMAVMAIMMVVCIVAMNKAMSSLTGAAKTADTTVKAATTAPTVMSATERAKAAVQDFIKGVIKFGDDLLETLEDLPATAKQAGKDAIAAGKKMAEDIGEALEEIFTKIFSSLDDVGGDMKRTTVTVKEMSKAEKVLMGSQLFGEIPSIVGGAIQGAMLLRVAQIMKDAGEIDAAIQLLEGMIKALEGLLKNLEGGMATRDDFVGLLQDLFKKLYDGASNSYGKAAGAAIAG
jgi:hypothetical protein